MPEIHIAVSPPFAFENNGRLSEKTASQTDGTQKALRISARKKHAVISPPCFHRRVGEQWQAEDLKTARFQTESTYQDVLFRGMSCPCRCLRTPESWRWVCSPKSADHHSQDRSAGGHPGAWGPPEDPSPSLYDQLLETLEDTGLRLEEVRDGVVLTVFFRGGEQRAFLRHSEVYVGSGPMPEGYRVQVDPTGEKPQLLVRASDGSIVQIPAIQGPRGEKGEKGDKGDPGPQGPRGDVGADVVRSVAGQLPDASGVSH